MSDTDPRAKTARPEILTTKTMLDEDEPGAAGARPNEPAGAFPHLTSADLEERYRALLQTGAIFYPVAYRIRGELGRGRQGVVFLGLRHGARGCVTRHAIKIYDPSIYASPERYWTDMGRIASQISKLQTVHAPYLVSREVYEESNGIGYVQMELVDGTDLFNLTNPRLLHQIRGLSTQKEWSRFTDALFRVDDGRVSVQPGVVVHILRQILRALEALHENGFVHSDIKPSNVMINRLGDVKVIDYGRAVRLHEKVSILLGTLHYMAPEVHRRESGRAQSDLYSVGIVGIELLTGRPVFQAGTEAELLEEKLRLPGRLHDLLPHYVQESQTFMRVLRTLIEPDPERRYISSREAESGQSGLWALNRELVRMNVDAAYERELASYMEKVAQSPGKRIVLDSEIL